MALTPIRTPRLTIRELGPQDRDAMLGFVSEPEQLNWMSIGFTSPQSVDDFLETAADPATLAERRDFHCAVMDTASGEYLGCVDLMREAAAPFAAELGYFFLRKHWGRGYAQEASRALVAFGFRELGLHRIWGKCHVDNLASAKVMAGIGMRHEGTLREHMWQRDHYRSSQLYAVLKSDWPTP